MRPYSPGGPLNAFVSAGKSSESLRPSGHRLGPGLPGYLIPFAPLAFAPQRQDRPSTPLSPPAFLLISTHSTAPPRVPRAPTCLKSASSPSHSSVEPRDFKMLDGPPTCSLSPVIPNNACPSSYRGCWHEVSRGFLWGCSTPEGIGLHCLLTPDSGLHPEGLHPTRGVAPSGLRPLRNIRCCSLP